MAKKSPTIKLSKVAMNLCIDTSTVQRIVAKFDATGQVAKKKYSSQNKIVKFTKPVQLAILHLFISKPDMYLWEIQQELDFMFNLVVSESSICRLLKESNFSRKKLELVALQRDEEIRFIYAADVNMFTQQSFIFLDETGSDRRDAVRKYGYGLRGRPLNHQKLLVRGERISAIAAMTVSGVLDVKIVRGSVQQKGSLIQFLPPYSPDYNPIEFLFAKVKSILRAMETELSITNDIETMVLMAFSQITRDDCRAWVEHIGLYNN